MDKSNTIHSLHILTNSERGKDVSFTIKAVVSRRGGRNSQFFTNILALEGGDSIAFHEGRASFLF